jgi:hypothetical protein
MCPFCLSSAAMLIAGTVSSGGIALLTATKLAVKFRKKTHQLAQPGNVDSKNSAASNALPR